MKCTATCAYGFSATKLCTSSLHLILYRALPYSLLGERCSTLVAAAAEIKLKAFNYYN